MTCFVAAQNPCQSNPYAENGRLASSRNSLAAAKGAPTPNKPSGMYYGHSVTFGHRAGKIMSHNDDPSYKLESPITY